MKLKTHMNPVDKVNTSLRENGFGATAIKILNYPIPKLYHKFTVPVCHRIGIPTPLRTRDRHYLEQTIFPYVAGQKNLKNILFAGSDFYTWHYHRFFPGKTFHTIDFNPDSAKYGSRDLHIIGSVCALEDYYPLESFDIIFFNGLIGFGLNDEASTQEALNQAFNALKSGGYLIIGWNDTPDYINFSIEKMPEYQRFMPFITKELNANRHRVETGSEIRHIFDFLQKP